MILYFSFVAMAAAAGSIPTVELATGVNMPMMVIGGENCSFPDIADYGSCSNYTLWTEMGGTGFDTAWEYQTSFAIRDAVHQSGLPRSEVFVVTKIPGSLSFNCTAEKCSHFPSPPPVSGHYSPEMVRDYIAKDLDWLGTEIGYIDVLLLHTPCNEGGYTHNFRECAAVWSVMEEAVQNGTVRAIGVSNFGAEDLRQLSQTWKIKPVVNQMRTSLGSVDEATWNYCKQEGIAYMAYSPLHSPCLHDEKVQAIATAHNMSVYQIALRWLVQSNISFVTATNKSSHMSSDLAVFGFSLNADDMATLNALQCGKKTMII